MLARRAAAALFTTAVMALASTSPANARPDGDPPYSVDTATLDAALDCDEFTHVDKEPVLLVHGTGVAGHEQWDWNYAILLRETGHDVCIVTYPARGFGDMQISAEYVAYAVQAIHERSGGKVDMVGHSQGATMPRWAVKWWPSVQSALDDFVLLAGPNHGLELASGNRAPPGGMAPVRWQFSPTSNFTTALNADDETPGDVDYTSIYSSQDELVRPIEPPTAALDLGREGPNVVNILTQDLCPLRFVDHLTIGLTDVLTQRLVLDAIDNPGPTDVARAGIDEVLCNLPDQYVVPDTFPNMVAQLERSFNGGFPEYDNVEQEPPLRDYAVRGDGEAGGSAESPAPSDDAATDGEALSPTVPSAARAVLPATGRTIPILAACVAIGVALLLRAGRGSGAPKGARSRRDVGEDA